MIGIYDYTVVLTYISLAISVIGMTRAVGGDFKSAIVCLALSGLCDMFDGKIARTKKNRTEEEKQFGVQIDSLCDVVCFGIFPALTCYLMGMNGILGQLVLAYYCVCSVIRLAFFNVLEAKRQKVEEGANKYYHGLPITSMAIALPVVYLLSYVLPTAGFQALMLVSMFTVGTLFVVDFPLKKPSNRTNCILVAVAGCAVIAILVMSKTNLIHFPTSHQMLLSNSLK